MKIPLAKVGYYSNTHFIDMTYNVDFHLEFAILCLSVAMLFNAREVL